MCECVCLCVISMQYSVGGCTCMHVCVHAASMYARVRGTANIINKQNYTNYTHLPQHLCIRTPATS